MNENIHSRIKQHATQNAEKVALICGGESLSYGEMQSRIAKWSSVFAARKCAKVAVALPNCTDVICMFAGASRQSINFQILSPQWPVLQIEGVLNKLAPDLVIATDDLCANLTEAMRLSDLHEEIEEEDTTTENCDPELAFYTGFTSGSTGLPKGFIRSQQSWLESFKSDQIRFEFRKSDCFLVMGGLSHSLPLYGAMRGLYEGATVYMSPTFRPDRLLRDCEAIGVSVIYGTPTQYRALLDVAQKEGSKLTSVRLALSAGSKFPNEWLTDLQRVFCNADAIEFFGTSELSYVAARVMAEDDPPELVGAPMPMVEVRILTDKGQAAKPDQEGQIFVKSPFLFSGYVNPDGEADLSTCQFQDGYLSVGDHGYIDAAGQLYLNGRSDRVFQVSGRTINPEGIEVLLCEDEAVQNAAVFGKSDPRRENQIVAVLKFKEAATHEGLLLRMRQKMPGYMIPAAIYVCQEWPLTHSHKTDFTAIMELLGKRELEKIL